MDIAVPTPQKITSVVPRRSLQPQEVQGFRRVVGTASEYAREEVDTTDNTTIPVQLPSV